MDPWGSTDCRLNTLLWEKTHDPTDYQGQTQQGWEKTSCSKDPPILHQFYRLVLCRICSALKPTTEERPKPLSSHSKKKMYSLTLSFQPSFFIYVLAQRNQMTNRRIEQGNDKLSWQFIPGGATGEHTFIYSLQMAPYAVTQEFNLCQLPSVWPEITSGKLAVGGIEALRNWFVELQVRLLQKHSQSPFHLSLSGETQWLPEFALVCKVVLRFFIWKPKLGKGIFCEAPLVNMKS